jgi:hypothetical protein
MINLKNEFETKTPSGKNGIDAYLPDGSSVQIKTNHSAARLRVIS